jgi:quinol monooxygenase YgiN
MIRHIVMFRFHAETPQPERDAFRAMLDELPAKIAEIQSFETGADIVRSPRAFDLALISTYADLAALDRYAKHPDHLPVVERAREICQQVASVDYEC